jgi:LacI family transcriptional regulator
VSLTLEQIAKLAGVSRSTVSRVVNDHPNVRVQVRQRVWQVIRETGYEPHAAARSLATHRTQIVGVIIPEAVTTLFTEPFFVRFLSGATEACNSNQYHLMLALLNDPAGQEAMYRRVVRGGHLDGAIVASTRLDDPLIPRLLEDRLPCVSVGRHPIEQVSYVDIDNVAAAQVAVEHLICLGHKRIGTITGRLNMSSGQDRLEGYRQALEAQRIPVEEELVVEGDFSEGSGATGAQCLISASATAIFAGSDSMAVGAMKTIRQAGLRVPQDIALVGFDDVAIATAVEPALTTVRQPIERLASMAVEVLLSMLENPTNAQSPAHKITLPTELVVRDSCGALQ